MNEGSDGGRVERLVRLQNDGRDALWGYFGCTRASWLTLPRVLMHAMPDDWQARMARLLAEYDDAFQNQPELGTVVQVTDMRGRLVKTPDWLLNYRHPDKGEIDALRSNARLSRHAAPGDGQNETA